MKVKKDDHESPRLAGRRGPEKKNLTIKDKETKSQDQKKEEKGWCLEVRTSPRIPGRLNKGKKEGKKKKKGLEILRPVGEPKKERKQIKKRVKISLDS